MILYKVIGLTLQASLLRDLFYNNCIFISLSTPRLTSVQQDENYEGFVQCVLGTCFRLANLMVLLCLLSSLATAAVTFAIQQCSCYRWVAPMCRQPFTSSSCAPSSCSYLVCCCRCRWLITTLLLSVLDIVLYPHCSVCL